MSSSVARTSVYALFGALLSAGCGDDGGSSAPADAGPDAGHDSAVADDDAAQPEADAGADAATNAGTADGATPSPCAEGCEPITVAFAARSGDADVTCNSALSVAGHDVNIADFRFYVSEVELIAADGSRTPIVLDEQVEAAGKPAFQGKQVALLDFENGTGSCKNGTLATNHSIVGRAPSGSYTGIAFSLGVPEALNHLNAATAKAPLNVTALFWTWKIGYMFTGIDLLPKLAADAGTGFFSVHLGSSACTGSPSAGTVRCARPNRARIELPAFDAGSQRIVLDLAQLLSGLDVTASADAVPGCMADEGDAECTQIFSNLGIDPATGAPGGPAQKAFSVEASP